MVLIPSGMALPCHLPLGTKWRQFLDSAAADDGEDFAVEILQGDGAVGTAVRCVGAEVAQQEHASLGDAVGQGQRVGDGLGGVEHLLVLDAAVDQQLP